MATVGFRGASDHRGVNAYIAHLSGVKAAVHAAGKAIQGRAEALFAPHNHPGRHEVVGQKQDTDYIVAIEGPVPHIVEFGRAAYTRSDGVEIAAMEGLHILGRAAGI